MPHQGWGSSDTHSNHLYSSFCIDHWTQGAGGFPNKLDALIWLLRLEVSGSNEDVLHAYCREVISMVSDQGALDCLGLYTHLAHSITTMASEFILLLFGLLHLHWSFYFVYLGQNYFCHIAIDWSSPGPPHARGPGTEFKLYESPKLDLEEVQADWARLLNTTVPTKADLDLDVDLQDEDSILSRKLGGNSEKMQKCIMHNNA